MNVFNLFETRDVESIKLGIQLVKTLDCHKPFEEYFKITLNEYEQVFNTLFWTEYQRHGWESYLTDRLYHNNMNFGVLSGDEIFRTLLDYPQFVDIFDLTKLGVTGISCLLEHQPQLIDYLDVSKLDDNQIYRPLNKHPQLIDKLNLTKLSGDNIFRFLCTQPQFIDRFDLTKLTKNDIHRLVLYQPQLKPYFDK